MVAEPTPCPICKAKGGFHDSHPFSLEWATETWGPPYAPLPDEEHIKKGYQPYVFFTGSQDEYVVILKKVVHEVSRGGATTQKSVQGDSALQPP